ncbi:Lrp/AsnC family transcriptional regulator [Nonomuraea sediminis]|uniref:Lrp/AsnC family transcriptional regulator n=1 Tax=Nonomuraea sediminis TaxID=2835864 RepID=UPI001BDC3F96|nr:Lrp/AsnC family transcriptional regulator [Nonomuraea sediminis]
MTVELDDVDRKIITELSRDARLSVRSLAERLHISRASAYSRLDRLITDGVVRGFSVRLDPAMIGLTTSAYVTLRIEQNSWREVSARLREVSGILNFALIGGDFDVLALVRVAGQGELRDLVLNDLHSIPGVLSTRTHLIFDESNDDMLLGGSTATRRSRP